MQAVNPFLPSWEYIPDGEPHVFDGRIYLFGSHDRFDGDGYCMNDYVCYSADTKNLKEWRYEGVIYRKNQDPRNQEGGHCMWAPDVAKGLDGRYYLYYCLDVLPEIGVAVSNAPTGPYEFMGLVHYPDGTPLGRKEKDYIQFDPGILIDEDGECYLYSGNGPRCKGLHENKASQVMRLEADMVTLKEDPRLLLPTTETSEGTGFEGFEFYEASSIRKIGKIYYLIYSDRKSSSLCYAVSSFPDRGFTFGGRLIDIGDIGIDGREAAAPANFLGNTHGGIECVNGAWYLFYHRQTNRTFFSRQACAELVTILPDGRIPQVRITSCGLNGGPLRGAGVYEARIACHLWGKEGAVWSRKALMEGRFPYFTQDGSDRESGPGQYIANMRDGASAGYRYFNLKPEGAIRLRVRGEARGRMLLLGHPDGLYLGEVPIHIFSPDWMAFDGTYTGAEKNGIQGQALYMKYEGTGALDFLDFEFL